ncbi:thermostable hemolysin [Marinobacter sp. C2H3]|uniref:thermostable hemolysin n=1 Tax=Marinobacter sp. C2H3 TaxID=3119003 RepID=UPI00300ED121
MTDPVSSSGRVSLDGPDVLPVLRIGRRWLSEVRPGSATAASVATFIRDRFRVAYGAEPALRIPGLLALTSGEGRLMAAVGARNAGRERLFLEDYLVVPVEQQMPEPGVPRHRIAEIAHLAGVEAGVSRHLFTALALWLDAARYDWVVCTGTGQLRNSVHRLGIETPVLGPADPLRLPDGGADWGRYYDHRPVVMAIHVGRTLEALGHLGLTRRALFLGRPELTLGALSGTGSDAGRSDLAAGGSGDSGECGERYGITA